MYTIKQAALRAGVSVALLRAWERRYGIVEPARTAAGYRLYDQQAVDRVRTMHELVDDGWSPSTAASSILAAVADGLPIPEAANGGRSSTGDGRKGNDGKAALPEALSSGAADPLIGRFVDAAAGMDQAGIEAGLDEMFARGSFERVSEQYVLPALRALGQAWGAGTIGVAAEHEASNAVLRRLAAAYEAAGRSLAGDVVLVGLPPLARHELGALAFAVAARRAGLNAVYLGADLPLDDWVRAAIDVKARAVVLGVVMASDVEPALGVVGSMRTAAPDVLVAFGGGAAPQPGAGGWIRLPDGIADAVDVLGEALRRRQ